MRSSHIINLLSRRNRFHFKVEGDSMLPLLRHNDTLNIKRVNFSKVKVNDVVVVNKRKIIFIHRVIYRTKKYLVTKGDNNLASDGRVYPKQVHGIVEQLKRNNQIINIDDIYLIQSTFYFNEIVKIKRAFEKAKIDFVFLKGLPIHLYYEEWHPKRLYADCDILVKTKNKELISETLIKLGYRKIATEYSTIHKLLRDKDTEDVFIKDLNQIPVVLDIHYEIVFLMNQLGRLDALYPQKYIDQLTDMFLRGKRMVRIHGINLPILSTENLIIYLALHFFHHNFKGIFRLEFLNIIVRYSKISNNPGVIDRLNMKISDFHLQNYIYPAYILVNKYFSTNIPISLLSLIRPVKAKLEYINKYILTDDIFSSEPRMQAGIKRFRILFYLSPNPMLQRITVICNTQVFYMVFWVLNKKIIWFLKRFSFSRGRKLLILNPFLP